jgi:hypothetical protein
MAGWCHVACPRRTTVSNERNPGNPLEAVRLALAELGDAPNEEVAAFVGRRYGVRIAPPFVPVARASLLGLEQLDAARRAAREALAEAAAESRAEKGQRE